MNGTIAQLVALACHGNAYLSDQRFANLESTNSAFQFCERIYFFTEDSSGKLTIVATLPEEWFEYLRTQSSLGTRLIWMPSKNPKIPDRMSSGFVGGGGHWFIIVQLPTNQIIFWKSDWIVGNQQAPDRRIWRVSYLGARNENGLVPASSTLSDAMKELKSSLLEIRSFCINHAEGAFCQNFDQALETLQTHGDCRHGYHKDLYPKGFLPKAAEAALDACQSASVFGGMGSWNDGLRNNAPEKYTRVSDRLFVAINLAIVAATNMAFAKSSSR